jgi:hypothetical protein
LKRIVQIYFDLDAKKHQKHSVGLTTNSPSDGAVGVGLTLTSWLAGAREKKIQGGKILEHMGELLKL